MSGCTVEYCISKPQVTQEGERSSPRALVWNAARLVFYDARSRHSPDSAQATEATGHRHSACDVCALLSFAFESVVDCGLRCALLYCTVPYSTQYCAVRAYFVVAGWTSMHDGLFVWSIRLDLHLVVYRSRYRYKLAEPRATIIYMCRGQPRTATGWRHREVASVIVFTDTVECR